jgi:hypothetical protein
MTVMQPRLLPKWDEMSTFEWLGKRFALIFGSQRAFTSCCGVNLAFAGFWGVAGIESKNRRVPAGLAAGRGLEIPLPMPMRNSSEEPGLWVQTVPLL